ncbi:LysR family transcriptional regulator, partial [Vibrio xuii]
GSFTRAAKQINRTQSAFSAQMRKLEEELSVNLFEKEGRNLVLSEAGLALRTHAQQLVELHNSAIKQVKRYEDKRPFRLGCPEDYNDKILPKVIRALQQAEPTCSIQVFSQPSVTLRTWLNGGKLDAAILTRAPNSEEGYWLASDTGV